MTAAVITFQGFTESGRRESGTEALYREVIRKHAGPDVMTVLPYRWDADPRDIAGTLARMGFASVIIIGYSWGAGYAAVRFAAECGRLGLAVPLMILCDAIYRPTWLPPWLGVALSLRAVLPGTARIKIPPNVRRVARVRQSISLPAGHPLAADDLHTFLGTDHVLPHCHTAIDSAPEWHALVARELSALLTPSTP